MLTNVAAPRPLETAVQAYLHDTLGIIAEIRPWDGTAKLPYFLTDSSEFRELRLLDRPILLAIDRQGNRPALATLRGQLDKLRAIAGQPVGYVTGTLASYERKRLIEQKVPFIVPGNQLYLPDLGIDLRQYFRQRAPRSGAELSPATQALLITILLRKPWRVDWQPAEVVAGLGYTAMTLSRAVRELIAAGIATAHNEGRTRWLRITQAPKDTWERAKPLLRSPVRRRVWTSPIQSLQPSQVRLAGLSALAHYSLLSEPKRLVYALSPVQWRSISQSGLNAMPEPGPDSVEWQLWSYSPALVPDSPVVDPLSLALSLQGETDERVQLALGELAEHFPW